MLRIIALTILAGVITFLSVLVISQGSVSSLILIGPLAVIYLILEILEGGDKK